MWVGAAAIVTNQVGRVLLVHPTYREDDRWLLPGGVVEPGEHPHVTCRREITEELGLADLPLSGVLAVHSLSPHHPDIQPGASCPGEIRYVFDGGTLTPDQVEAIRLPHEELSEFAFLETRDAVERLRPVDGQIMLAAYRARLGNTATAHLADGRHILDVPALDRHDVHVRYRPLWDSPLDRGPVPERLPVQQAWAWCFVPDGRVVLVADPGPRGALPMLPGGTVEKTDTTPEDTLHREAAEEAQLTLTDPVRLGWVLDETGEVYGGVGPNARLRLAARVTAIGPAAVDPATGHPFARLLATPVQAAALLGWGPPGARQARLAAETARERWGLPTARPTAIEEVPAEGMRLS
ncbi:NUDIX hydrolase [Streptomyces sp. NBC_01635]|uniref:NUDIX hydrolase n=1 Tax=Streptomyces TaxID=1883 RepID=UPI000B1A207D|nr:NUDIX hydrolase [Streptomyces prasinus]WTD78309.1 NUDIX hydrolase [Streptomyces sp. NBC_01635]